MRRFVNVGITILVMQVVDPVEDHSLAANVTATVDQVWQGDPETSVQHLLLAVFAFFLYLRSRPCLRSRTWQIHCRVVFSQSSRKVLSWGTYGQYAHICACLFSNTYCPVCASCAQYWRRDVI
jgi:hypothetical protein